MTAQPRILLFGATGIIGFRLCEVLSDAGYDVTGIDRAACDFSEIDSKKIEVMIRAVEPGLIINAAAYTDIDEAEIEPELAEQVNTTVPTWIAKAAHAHAIPFLHFSTDYVFDGARGAPYREDTATRPMNVYGQTRYDAEQAVLAEKAHVFRVQWVIDHRGKNFLTVMPPLLHDRAELGVVADQLAAPTYALHLAEAVTKAVPLILDGRLPSAVYHLSAGGYTSWHGLACAIAEVTGSRTHLTPITSAEYPLRAIRPHNTRLDCSALAAHGITMPHWRESLAVLLDHATKEIL